MSDAEKIVDKILPENKECPHQSVNPKQLCLVCKAENDIRLRLLSTYGKEWVGLPSVQDIKDILYCEFNKIHEKQDKAIKEGDWGVDGAWSISIEEMLNNYAESILKGLRGK